MREYPLEKSNEKIEEENELNKRNINSKGGMKIGEEKKIKSNKNVIKKGN